MDKFLDVEWIAVQAGVPVSFLIGIPFFFAFVLTLASMMGTKEPENYRVGRHAEAKSSNTWIAPIGLMIFIGIALSNFGQYFLPS
jgi:hypothetical protein